jgi:hypothetical protein
MVPVMPVRDHVSYIYTSIIVGTSNARARPERDFARELQFANRLVDPRLAVERLILLGFFFAFFFSKHP